MIRRIEYSRPIRAIAFEVNLMGAIASADATETTLQMALARTMQTAIDAGFSGVELAGTERDVLYESATGLADLDTKRANSSTAPWRWASVSKQVTAIIVAQLVAEGKLTLERRGAIGGVQVRNIIAPSLYRVIVIFTNSGDWNFGEIWQGKGFSHDILSAARCNGA